MAKQAKPKHAERDGIHLWTWVLAATVVLLTVFVRIRLMNMPLERDEGEFATMGQLLLNGIPPYKLAYNMKLPGIYAVYALIMAVFGQTIAGIRIGLLLANLSAAVLVFALARRLWSTRVALVSGASYPVLTLGVTVLGPAAHATQFQMPMVLGALLLLLKALERDRRWLLFWSGLLMGIAVITKQQAVPFVAFGGCYLIWDLVRTRSLPMRTALSRAGIYVAGATVPFAATCVALYIAGVFDTFWFWTFTYARHYVVEISPSFGFSLFIKSLGYVQYIAVLAGLAVIGLATTWWDAKLRIQAPFVTGLLLFGFLAVCPGLYFRTHYYVQIMPAVALLIGLSADWVSGRLSGTRYRALVPFLPVLLLTAGVAQAVVAGGALFFEARPNEAAQILYGRSPFPESIVIGRYIREHSAPGEKFVVLGSEPQIYFYADRPPASGYLYAYALMEPQPYASEMQSDMIREIEAAKPKFIVYVNMSSSWLFRSYSDKSLIFWFAKYAGAHYKIVGLADIDPEKPTEYFWGEDAEFFAPDAVSSVCVLERKSER